MQLNDPKLSLAPTHPRLIAAISPRAPITRTHLHHARHFPPRTHHPHPPAHLLPHPPHPMQLNDPKLSLAPASPHAPSWPPAPHCPPPHPHLPRTPASPHAPSWPPAHPRPHTPSPPAPPHHGHPHPPHPMQLNDPKLALAPTHPRLIAAISPRAPITRTMAAISPLAPCN